MLNNKKGVALLQVLIVSAILAGMAAMILRATLSRTVTARQTRHTVAAQLAIEACMVEINHIWANKTPEAYAEDLANCVFNGREGLSETDMKTHTCTVRPDGATAYTVTATIKEAGEEGNPPCKITYRVADGVNL